jgi:hypothetical protein
MGRSGYDKIYSGAPANDIKEILETTTREEPKESPTGYVKINRTLVPKGSPEHLEFRRKEREDDRAMRALWKEADIVANQK